MSRIVSTVARILPASLKRKAKTAVWRLFTQLDDSVGANMKSAPVPLPAVVPAAQNVPGSPDLPPGAASSPALVVNESGTIANAGILRLSLCAIFETPTLMADQEEIFDFLCAHSQYLANDEQLVQGIRSHLMARLTGRPLADQGAALANLQSLYTHERKTAESRRAYSPKGRLNPDAVFWPDPTRAKSPRSLFTELPFARAQGLIARHTPIGSAGSCFAIEIAQRLQAEGFHYVVTEPHVDPDTGFSNSCARWGIIFNTPSFRQLIEKAFGARTLPKLLWSRQESGRTVYLDPFREDILFHSVEEYEADCAPHLAATRRALLEAKVFVLTLGMNEIWRLKSDGSVFSRAPWRIGANLVETKVLTVEENLHELQTMLDTWRAHNPDVTLIVSVSPVPLHATYRAAEAHVVTANCHSKSVLRVVAEEFAARNRDVYYFPSYEVVMSCTPDAWLADQRHVSRKAVDNVMRLFHRMFVADPEAVAAQAA